MHAAIAGALDGLTAGRNSFTVGSRSTNSTRRTHLNYLTLFSIALAMQMPLAQGADTTALCAATPQRFAACIKPSETDAAIRQFDFPHWVMFDRDSQAASAPLLVFMVGTGGKPPGPLAFLDTAAKAGYRVISLAYNDEPAIAVYCPNKPDPACSGELRQMRVFGDRQLPDESIRNSQAESIVGRLVSLLRYLDAQHPQDGWRHYLLADQLNWSHIAFAGQSQGAGMAAYIAKQKAVQRVILFSSPWDFYNMGGGQRRLAPWLTAPSKTDAARWYAGYHVQEKTADQLAIAYQLLAVPAANIRAFDQPLPPGVGLNGPNPYHGQGVHNAVYAAHWNTFLNAHPPPK